MKKQARRVETFVLVSQRTSSCWTRNERWPATWLPKHHGIQWQPGWRTSSNFPKVSLIATVDWSTWTHPKTWPSVFVFCINKKKCKQEHTVKNKTEHQTKHDNAARSYNFRKWDHQVKKNNNVRNKTTKILNRTIQTKSKEILKTCQIFYDNQITFVVRQADSYSIRYDDLMIKQPQNPSSFRKQTKP